MSDHDNDTLSRLSVTEPALMELGDIPAIATWTTRDHSELLIIGFLRPFYDMWNIFCTPDRVVQLITDYKQNIWSEAGAAVRVSVRCKPVIETEIDVLLGDGDGDGDADGAEDGQQMEMKVNIDSHEIRVMQGQSTCCFNGVFDDIIGEDRSWKSMYYQTCAPLIDALLDGYNCSMLAIGGLNSGTFNTLFGDDKTRQHQHGMVQRCLIDTVSRLQKKQSRGFLAKFEVYYNAVVMEHSAITDVFDEDDITALTRKLQIGPGFGEDTSDILCTYIENVRQFQLTDLQQSIAHINRKFKSELGVEQRRQNIVFIVNVLQSYNVEGEGRTVRSQLKFVQGNDREMNDLLVDTEYTARRMYHESAPLNVLLTDSFYNNRVTRVVACCSPEKTAMNETLSTLQFAHTVRTKIRNKPNAAPNVQVWWEVYVEPQYSMLGAFRLEIDPNSTFREIKFDMDQSTGFHADDMVFSMQDSHQQLVVLHDEQRLKDSKVGIKGTIYLSLSRNILDTDTRNEALTDTALVGKPLMFDKV